jgi:cellulose synthase/poly-beta-1,6-N-acetylglucosamine synthase-like glycosyltransferase
MLILLLVATATYLATALLVAIFLGRKIVPGDAIGDADLPHVAVVVAARDEEKNLPVRLDALLTQDYPAGRFRIVVVNDYSEDGTSGVAHDFAQRDERIQVVDSAAANLQPGKAAALAAGIDSTSAEVILTTDADCIAPSHWVRSMAQHVTRDGVGAIGGPTTVSGQSVRDQAQAIDWMLLLAVAGASSHAGRPITAMGLNMGFQRKPYDLLGGYESFSTSPTEDYELFRALDRLPGYRSRLVIDPSLRMVTQPADTLRQAFSQRRRWARGGLRASPSTYALYVLAWSAHVLPLLLLFFEPGPALLCCLIKFAGDAAAIHRFARRIRTSVPWRAFIPFELFLSVYVVLMPASLLLAPDLQWKGRHL